MLVIIKSGPDTREGNRGLSLARSLSADVVLLQNAVYFSEQQLEEAGVHKTVYILEDDRRLRGLCRTDQGAYRQGIGYDQLVDLMSTADKTVGMF